MRFVFFRFGFWPVVADQFTFHIYQSIAVKNHFETGFLCDVLTNSQQIDVVPAIGVEGILNDGRAQNELNLAARHIGLQFFYHLGGYDVALLYEDLIDTGKANSRAC